MFLLVFSSYVNYVGFMKAFIHTLVALGVFITLTSCNRDITTPIEELSVIDMVATHDFETDMPISRLAFVPNNVAPWLGRVILLSEGGKLYSTDIEGRDPKPVGSSVYTDIFGLKRDNAPGVFLAINADGGIEAFLEADDEGNFSQMIYLGENLSAVMFCPDTTAPGNTVMVLSPDNYKTELVFEIMDGRIGQSIKNQNAVKGDPENCRNSISFPFILRDGLVLMLDPLNQGDGYRINLNDGLSIRGLTRANLIATTTANYGGTYVDGLVAFGDAQEQRLVFISFDYLTRKLDEIEQTQPPQ